MTTDDFDAESLTDKMMQYQPNVLCFNGKRAGQAYLGRKVTYGLQSEMIGRTRLYVTPSTSGAANRWWDISSWEKLASLCRRQIA